jgi:hypothetical protein
MSEHAGKVALITGITGQDGSYLTELLLSKGYTVSFDRYLDVWQYLVDFLWLFCGYASLCVAEIFVADVSVRCFTFKLIAFVSKKILSCS